MGNETGKIAYATAEHVAATSDASAKVREGTVIARILDGIVKNKYANDPGKEAAWISASPSISTK